MARAVDWRRGGGERGMIRRVASLALVLLVTWCHAGARAQETGRNGGFAVREVSLSSGYTFVQLPPITLGGRLPEDALNEDLITIGAAAVEWRRATSRTTFALDLFGTYTARARYSKLNAPGSDLTFGVSRALASKFWVGAGAANTVISSDQLAFQPPHVRRLIDNATSFDELVGTVAVVRSPSPDVTQASLFVPIRQSLIDADLSTNRLMASSARVDAAYAHSARLATYAGGSYTTVRRLSSNHAPGQAPASPDSTAEQAGVSVRYDSSKRTQLTTSLEWSRMSGGFTDETVTASVAGAWSGRKWFAAGTVGAALRPFAPEATPESPTTSRDRPPMIVFSAVVGYKFRAQTLLAQYSRAAHDEYGNGGSSAATGFGGDLQSAVGSWSWSAPRGQWSARSDLSVTRRPGNFSYIYAWLSTFTVGRRLGPDVRLEGEVLFDRHGSRGFEGFHLARERARVSLVWSPAHRRSR
jgi:hypothetical protein